MSTVNKGKIMIILYIIVGLIIIGIISAIWDVLKAIVGTIVGIAAAIGIVVLIGWVYSLLGYPAWLIWLLVAILVICNPVCLILYLVRKGKAIKALKKAADVSEEINRVESEEIKEKIENQISKTMAERGMATDVEVYDGLKDHLEDINVSIDTLNKKKQELKEWLKNKSIFSPGVKVIDQALAISDMKEIFKERFQKLVESGEIVVETNLNGEDETVLSWDKKLYKSTKMNPQPSNMLPTMHLEVD